ncbi:chitooligosaccharidolytic beta-N-acetylglucosaminidase-like [Zeugodacus cucurbitae]|uniref:chitooligosaccharidolytic beta-N-acetylglucosaminidase-like n=1 Tax=Zeugodacus cucurbitae TaxID=28588 RepID=UPI0023D9044E|nr:chitooligosaccharidolytic beta-N-acetylglucosaminidase-like [Zeugodacus cucurbitae]
MKLLTPLLVVLTLSVQSSCSYSDDLIYGYECQKNRCVKVELDAQNFQKAISLPVCRLFCGDNVPGTIWPRPSGLVNFDSYMLTIDPDNIQFSVPTLNKQAHLWAAIKERFMQLLYASVPNKNVLKKGGRQLIVNVELPSTVADVVPKLTLDTDESYTLQISSSNNSAATATISASNYFGAHHGLETLSQVIIYDDIRRELQILARADIDDKPAFKWRGLLLDTSRNYFSVKSIKRTLDAMATVKLNTFHWHITDSHSFPFEVKSQPDLYKLGAYSPRKVYSHEYIADIVEYGRVRGIRVMPEFDAPAHVGEGWQHKDMIACFNAQPWKNYCLEPPCGQFDPTVEDLYPILEDIYREMFELFDPDVFHMGGDEVSVSCWNSSKRIQDWMLQKGWGLNESDFIRLWGHFQTEALKRVDTVAHSQQPTITLWTSPLTDVPYIDEYLDKERYNIQIWTTGSDSKIKDILARGYRVIISNYDVLYFDCGGPGWVTDGNNWCSPYIGWQKVYDNNLDNIAGEYKSQVLGAEAAVWSEQIDEYTLDSRFWPRASALAERLWSNPKQTWRSAEARMLYHRERLTEIGIGAESMQPEWCLQNDNQCPVNAYNEKF